MLATMFQDLLYLIVDLIVVGAVYLVLGPVRAAIIAAHVLLCQVALMYTRNRGLLTMSAHLVAIDLGFLYGGWGPVLFAHPHEAWATIADLSLLRTGWWGLILISFPAILFFWVGLIGFAFFVLPVQLHEWEDAARCMIGFVTGYHYSYHIVKGDQVEEILPGKLTRKGQFPGLVLADAHTVVPLSTGMGLSRVAGPGVTFTRRAERPYQKQVMDLRTQIRPGKVRATTRDGIDVEFFLPVVFSIERWPPARPPVQATPFSEAAVLNAAISQRAGTNKWDEAPLDLAKNIARAVIAGYLLDRLLEDEKPAEGPAAEAMERIADRRARLVREHRATMPREVVREEIQKRLTEAIHKLYGIKLIGVGLGNIEVAGSDEVRAAILKQRVATWQAEWMSESVRRRAQSDAEAAREIGRARAQSQMRMIQALAEGFAQAQEGGKRVRTDLVVLLRLLDAMEEMTREPIIRERMPEEMLRAQTAIKLAAQRAAGH